MTFNWQSLPILSKVLRPICLTITIVFFFALIFSILLLFVLAIPGILLCARWASILGFEDFTKYKGSMKVPTFYSTSKNINRKACVFVMFVVGVVFGGIHCAGWFFNFPSSDEAMLWRVCSAIITSIPFLLPLVMCLGFLISSLIGKNSFKWPTVVILVLTLIAYVVSRLLLLVEAFISLRYLTPGMLALVRWTSFISHI